jgi:prolipoprotein diacylglyceryltransferase
MQRAKFSLHFKRFAGQLTLLFFALYAVERAVVEIFRNGATATPILGTSWLTQAQFASGIGLIVVAALWVALSRRAPSIEYSNRMEKAQTSPPKL